jgi:hypothetical protein
MSDNSMFCSLLSDYRLQSEVHISYQVAGCIVACTLPGTNFAAWADTSCTQSTAAQAFCTPTAHEAWHSAYSIYGLTCEVKNSQTDKLEYGLVN